MRIQPLVLTAMLLSPMTAMADGYHHQKRYTTQRFCYKEIYKEEYVTGNRFSKGYVKSYADKVEVPCTSLSGNSPVRRHRHHHHFQSFPHIHRRYYRPSNTQVLVSRSYRTSGGSCIQAVQLQVDYLEVVLLLPYQRKMLMGGVFL